eukprot:GEMP01007235.1.p1 GENE.GEMP01007235.1~~GEMP01007235.1.p1  ORF type:complete len:765 (+),score=177.57 GEMP01007235.1:190-2484(+)
MLRIDVKKTDVVDLQKPLMAYCENFYGAEASESVRPLIQQLHNFRAELKNITSASGHELATETLQKYLAVISLMEKRFPWGEAPNTVRVKTTWYDPMRPKEKVVMSSLPMERACAVFNLAAVASCAAADTDRATAEGQKLAIQKFQSAAGLFNLCRNQLLAQIVGPPLTVDLTENGLNMFSSLMLAQAQSCFYESAVRDRLGRGLLSKLAHQVADFYAAAITNAKKISGSIEPAWLRTFECQETAFRAGAHFQQACLMKEQALASMSGFGLCVRRFMEAKMIAQEAATYKMTDVTHLLSAIDSEMRPVESDNNGVYMEIVPQRTALPPLGKVATVKATNESIDKLDVRTDFQGYRTVLEQLLPQEVRSYAQDFKVRVESLVAAIDEEGRQYAAGIEDTMNELNLPYCLEAPSVGVSDDLWNKVQQVQTKGGAAALFHTLDALSEMDKMVFTLGQEIEAELNKEEQEDNEMRQRFSGQWTRPPSGSLNSTFRSQIQVYMGKMEQAREANKTIAQRCVELRPLMPKLDKTRHELDRSLPEGGSAKGGEAVDRVIKMMIHLEETRAETQRVADALKQEILQAPIDADLLGALQQQQQLADVVSKKVDTFGQSRIHVTVQRQKITDALSRVREAFEQMGAAGLNNARVAHLQEIDRTATRVLQSLDEASEGINFFSRLGDYFRTIQQQTNDFCFARNEEKIALLNSLTRSFSQPSAPPAVHNPNLMPTGVVTGTAPHLMPGAPPPVMGVVIQNPYNPAYPTGYPGGYR